MADAVHSSGIPAQGAEGSVHGHDAGHGHSPYPFVAHHFETPAQQFDAGKCGMWLFLVTEVLFFSGLFCAYAVYRRTHPDIFIVGSRFLDVKWGAINTVVLIASSFTMAAGVWCAQTSRKTGLIFCLIATLCGAFGFMGIKFVEYKHKLHEGIIWGADFNPQRHDDAHATAAHAAAGHAADPHTPAAASADHAAPVATSAAPAATEPAKPVVAAAPADSNVLKVENTTVKSPPSGATGLTPPHQAGGRSHADIDPYAEAKKRRDLHIFMGIYFCLTGLHGFHVLGGIVVIAWLLFGAIKGRYNSQYFTPVDLVGLYWHIVDLVWIFLFPLLYLI